MTKKLLALLLAALMLCASSAMAEDTLAFVFDESTAPYEGAWTDMGVGVAMYLPVDWQILEVPEEFAAKGIISMLASADNTMSLACGLGLAVDSDGNALTDTAALAAVLANGGYQGVVELLINGIPAVVYEKDASNVLCAGFLSAEGYFVTFSFTPKSDENAVLIGTSMLMSMSVMAAE